MSEVTEKEAECEKDYFVRVIDQQKVADITVDFFYRSHTIALLLFVLFGLIIVAFTRTGLTSEENYFQGGLAVCGLFLMISTMILPNGPFTRPHPAIWRIIFGASLLYFLVLVFVLFMKLEEARAVLHFIDPSLKNLTHSDILDKDYAVNCSELTFRRIYSHLDVFALAHFLGWFVKAILLRHYWLTWLLSINWEITELAFCHVLPNFAECWWDSIFLDIIICNGFGIYAGMKIVQWLEMRTYHWESVQRIQSTTGKIKRIVLQFTPASWTPTCWLNSESGFKRGILLSILVVVWQFAELNSFFLKHVFIVKPSNPLTMARLGLITLISAPAIRQFYLYVADPNITRIGSQLWMFLAILMTEFVVWLKFGIEVVEKTSILYITCWVIWLIFSSFATVFLCLWFTHAYNQGRSRCDSETPPESPMKRRKASLKKLFLNQVVKSYRLIRKSGQIFRLEPMIEGNSDDQDYKLYSENNGNIRADYNDELYGKSNIRGVFNDELYGKSDYEMYIDDSELIFRDKSD